LEDEMEIIVNGSPVEVSKPRQHYNDLCIMAGIAVGGWPTITYSRAARDRCGTCKPGSFVRVRKGTIVNVVNTGAA
jgi:hypothetical protein